MKTKNVIFRLLAVIVAIGGAVASVNASFAPGQAHLSYTTVGGMGFCTTIANNPCTIAGSFICTVQIGVNGVATNVTSWNHRATPGVCLTRFTGATFVVTPIAVNKTIPSGYVIKN